MTQEEKARAYDEALEKVRPLYEQAKKDGNPIWSTYEFLFPELRESEDEMIRNCLLVQLETNYKGNHWAEKAVAYLKKQEQKPELVQQPPITYTYNSNASRDERLKAALLALLNSDLLKVKEGGYFTKQDLIEWVEKIPTDKPAWSEENEKFRKYILQACKECVEANDMGLELSMSTTKKLLAYLERQKEDKEELVYRLNGLMQDYIKEGKDDEEKEHRLKCYQLFWDALEDTNFFEQKEQKPNIELIQRSWYMEGYHDREFGKEPKWIIKTGEGGPKYELNPKYGQPLADEQKPVLTAKEAWKEMRLEVYAQASGNRHEPNYSDDSTKMFSLCDIDEIFEKIGNSTVEQKPAEWSDDIIQKAVKEVGLTQHQIDWFKTNVFPPKQEWSEEDEKMLTGIIERGSVQVPPYTTALREEQIEWLMNRLKSLRPDTFQNGNSRPKTSDNWKPSEEQMRALNKVVNGEVLLTTQHESLESLYEQLKKL